MYVYHEIKSQEQLVEGMISGGSAGECWTLRWMKVLALKKPES